MEEKDFERIGQMIGKVVKEEVGKAVKLEVGQAVKAEEGKAVKAEASKMKSTRSSCEARKKSRVPLLILACPRMIQTGVIPACPESVLLSTAVALIYPIRYNSGAKRG